MADVSFTIEAIDKSTSAINGIRGAILTMNQAVQLAGQVYQAFNRVIQATVLEYVKYADQVRRLSQLNGTNAQETSRLIQVTDDYKVSVDALTMATRQLARDGQSLTVDTLSKMSDEYNKLGTSAQKTAFLIEKFGRSGLQFAEMMQSGSAAIKSSGSLAGLILNERDLKMARDYEKTMDEVNDQWMSIKVSIGSIAVPYLMTLSKVIGDQISGWKELFKYIDLKKAQGISNQITELEKMNSALQEQLNTTRIGSSAFNTYSDTIRDNNYQISVLRGQVNGLTEDTQELADTTGDMNIIIAQTDWETLYTDAKDATEQAATSLDWLGEQLQVLSVDGANVWRGFLAATGEISPAAIKEFMNIQFIWGETERMVKAGISADIVIRWLISTTGAYAGADPAFSRWQGNQSSSGGGGGWKYMGTKSGPGSGGREYNADLGIWRDAAERASGGYVSGRYAITGDSLSGRPTGYEELVDFQQKRVYSAPETRSMGAVPGYAAGSGDINLSRQTINDLTDLLTAKLAPFL